jgi:hypothetical protein
MALAQGKESPEHTGDWLGPRAGLVAVEKISLVLPAGNRTTDPPQSSQKPSDYYPDQTAIVCTKRCQCSQ